MKYTNKMVIVPEEIMNKLGHSGTSERTGIKRQVDEFRNELERLLRNVAMTPEEAYKAYMELYSRYINLERESNEPITVMMKEKTSESPLEYTNVWLNDKLLSSFPKNKQRKAAAFVQYIKDNNFLTNQKGEIIVDGRVIAKSHIIDLIYDFTRNKTKGVPPIGYIEFANVLKSKNVPKEFIGNADRLDLIYESGNDYKMPAESIKSSVDEYESASDGPSSSTVTPKRRLIEDSQKFSKRTRKALSEKSQHSSFMFKPKSFKYAVYED